MFLDYKKKRGNIGVLCVGQISTCVPERFNIEHILYNRSRKDINYNLYSLLFSAWAKRNEYVDY